MVSINWKWVFAGVVALAALAWHHWDKREAINRIHADYALKAYKSAENVNKVTISLLNSSLESLQKKDDEIKRITDKHNSLADSLRSRPSRTDSSTPQVGKACTGAELLREDGLFLAGEAARAERIKQERDFYYEQYERARTALGSAQAQNERLYGKDAH